MINSVPRKQNLFHMLSQNGVASTRKPKKGKDAKAICNFVKYQTMDNNGKENYLKKQRAKHRRLDEKLEQECELWEMAMSINRKYSGLSYALTAQALVSLLRYTIKEFGGKDVVGV